MHLLELIYLLFLKELKIRYKSNFFGYLWAIANPLAFTLIYYFAFKTVLNNPTENYLVYLLSGVFPWAWIASSINYGSMCFRGNSGLVKKVKINRLVLPFSISLTQASHFLFSIPILFSVIFFSHGSFYISWLWQIPLLILLQIFFLFPVTSILGYLNVLMRDVEYIANLLVSMLFFLCPIVYEKTLIPEFYLDILSNSPFFALIDAWHGTILNGNMSIDLIQPLILSIIVLNFFCYYLFSKVDRKIGELL